MSASRHNTEEGIKQLKLLRSRIVHAVAAASFLVAATAVAAPAAFADPPPPCYGSTCNGRDPQAVGCAGSFAYTVASFPVDYGFATVNLRYSDWCHANWATVTVNTAASNDGGEFWVENQNGDTPQYYGFNMDDVTTYWTNMINGIPLARACENDNVTYPDPAHPGCTGWH